MPRLDEKQPLDKPKKARRKEKKAARAEIKRDMWDYGKQPDPPDKPIESMSTEEKEAFVRDRRLGQLAQLMERRDQLESRLDEAGPFQRRKMLLKLENIERRISGFEGTMASAAGQRSVAAEQGRQQRETGQARTKQRMSEADQQFNLDRDLASYKSGLAINEDVAKKLNDVVAEATTISEAEGIPLSQAMGIAYRRAGVKLELDHLSNVAERSDVAREIEHGVYESLLPNSYGDSTPEESKRARSWTAGMGQAYGHSTMRSIARSQARDPELAKTFASDTLEYMKDKGPDISASISVMEEGQVNNISTQALAEAHAMEESGSFNVHLDEMTLPVGSVYNIKASGPAALNASRHDFARARLLAGFELMNITDGDQALDALANAAIRGESLADFKTQIKDTLMAFVPYREANELRFDPAIVKIIYDSIQNRKDQMAESIPELEHMWDNMSINVTTTGGTALEDQIQAFHEANVDLIKQGLREAWVGHKENVAAKKKALQVERDAIKARERKEAAERLRQFTERERARPARP